jgi:uncharacterized protein
VHISALSEKFVKDPREVVKAGDIVKVKVMEVDISRKRVALSMRLRDTPPAASGGPLRGARERTLMQQPAQAGSGALADALKRAITRN